MCELDLIFLSSSFAAVGNEIGAISDYFFFLYEICNMLAFFRFLFWQYDICPYVSSVSQIAHRVILVSFCFLFYSVFISFFRALLFMLTGFSVTFLLTTPKSIFQYLLTQCWLSLCCVVVFMTFLFGMDVIKLSRVGCRQEQIVARRAVSVLLSIYISYLPLTLMDACKVLLALL